MFLEARGNEKGVSYLESPNQSYVLTTLLLNLLHIILLFANN